MSSRIRAITALALLLATTVACTGGISAGNPLDTDTGTSSHQVSAAPLLPMPSSGRPVAAGQTSEPTARPSATPFMPSPTADPTLPPSTPDQTPEATATSPFPAGYLPADQAPDHAGQKHLVCGRVASAGRTSYATFLNLEEPYPDQVFTIIIWDEDESRYEGSPRDLFSDQDVCVEGRISLYEGVPQIKARANLVREF